MEFCFPDKKANKDEVTIWAKRHKKYREEKNHHAPLARHSFAYSDLKHMRDTTQASGSKFIHSLEIIACIVPRDNIPYFCECSAVETWLGKPRGAPMMCVNPTTFVKALSSFIYCSPRLAIARSR